MTKEQLVLLTVKELKAIAKENGLKGYSKLRKVELVDLLAVEEVAATNEVVEVAEVQEVEKAKTVQILDAFFDSCLKFWQNEKDRGYTDTRSVEALALNDIQAIKNNPFSPNGKALDIATKESWLTQKILNSYLKGDLTPAIGFTLVENKMLSSYEVMHNIEELENVSFIFPATEVYKEAKEKYYNFRSEKAWHDLMAMQECELEELYVYDSPSEICYNGTFYIVHNGMVVGGDEPKKSDCKIKYTAVEDWMGNTLITYEGEQTTLADETIDTFILNFLKEEGILKDDTEFYDWVESNEEEYNSYREDYYILCYDEEGNNVAWSW